MTQRVQRVRRVLLLHEYPGGFGGAERYLELLAAGLNGQGIETAAVVFANDPPSAARFVDALAAAGAAPVELHRWRSRPLAILRAVGRFRPDVIHWNSVDPFAFRGALMTLLPWGRPGVLTDHLPMLRTGPHWETTRRLVNRRLPAVIVVGEQGAEAAKAHWPGITSLRVVPNGVPTGSGRVRAARGDGPVRVVFAGRLTDQKDPLFLLDVVDELARRGQEVQLVIAGDGPLAAELDGRIGATPSLQTAVERAGFVDDPREVFAAAEVYVAPARYEGMPFTPLEALASGLPAVLSDIPPHAEIARGAPDGVVLVALGDVSGWADAIGEVAGRLPDASRAALDGAARFSVDRMVERTVAIYAGALAG